MGNAGITRDAFSQLHTARNVHRFEQLFNPLVQKEKAGFQVDYRLAIDTEAKVARFDDARMNRPHRDLVRPLALHVLEREWTAVVFEHLGPRSVFAYGGAARRTELTT